MYFIDSVLGKKNRRLLKQDEKSNWVFHLMLPMQASNPTLCHNGTNQRNPESLSHSPRPHLLTCSCG